MALKVCLACSMTCINWDRKVLQVAGRPSLAKWSQKAAASEWTYTHSS